MRIEKKDKNNIESKMLKIGKIKPGRNGRMMCEETGQREGE